MNKVIIQEIMDGMEMQSDENLSFVNLQTGEIVQVSQEMLSITEDSNECDVPEWQQDELEVANTILENEMQFAQLPPM